MKLLTLRNNKLKWKILHHKKEIQILSDININFHKLFKFKYIIIIHSIFSLYLIFLKLFSNLLINLITFSFFFFFSLKVFLHLLIFYILIFLFFHLQFLIPKVVINILYKHLYDFHTIPTIFLLIQLHFGFHLHS